jgi:hypothetical protein
MGICQVKYLPLEGDPKLFERSDHSEAHTRRIEALVVLYLRSLKEKQYTGFRQIVEKCDLSISFVGPVAYPHKTATGFLVIKIIKIHALVVMGFL